MKLPETCGKCMYKSKYSTDPKWSVCGHRSFSLGEFLVIDLDGSPEIECPLRDGSKDEI